MVEMVCIRQLLSIIMRQRPCWLSLAVLRVIFGKYLGVLMILRWVLIALSAVILTGCTEGTSKFPVTQEQQDRLEADVDIIRLNEVDVKQYAIPYNTFGQTSMPSGRSWRYLIGPGDVLTVVVFDHPELTLPGGLGSGLSGFQVAADGSFNYPFIGRVQAKGHTVEEVRSDVAKRLAEFIPDPQVDLRITSYKAKSVAVTGEVGAPSKQVLNAVPLTLLDAITASGGLTPEADSHSVTVRRHTTTYKVNLAGFLEQGIARNNPVLRNGDVVNVPRRKKREAYILGEVGAAGVVNLNDDNVTLTQALARQSGVDELRADARGIFVFRLVNGRQTVYQLDASIPSGLVLGTQFNLFPNDVVYVVRSPLTRWNDTISRILPSVAAYQAGQVLGN